MQRLFHLIRVSILLSMGLMTISPAPAEENGFDVNSMIQRIGNEENEDLKIQWLHDLQHHPNFNQALQEDLHHLLQEIKRWNSSPRLEYFDGFMRKNLRWNFHLSENSPFYPLTDFYQARMLIWCAMEHGNIWSNAEVFRLHMDQARRLLHQSKQNFPQNRLVRMYLGESIPFTEGPAHPAGAPEWAVYQREGLERIADIVIWWTENRLQENGEYGGGWGDDCEMWRWWFPVLIAFDDPQITQAQAYFSNALLSQPHMQGGYTSR
ncbi:MAG: hypothetical protein ACP5I1_08685, partial [Candidatus Hinthialibacter sp.]